MSTFDVYGATDKLNNTVLGAIVTRLEARGKHRFFQKMMHEYLDTMDIDSAKTVLDLGCGTGVATRGIAHRTNFSGMILGIDISPHLVAAAQRLTGEEAVEHNVEYRVGDTSNIDIEDQSFEAVVAHTLVSHVDDPGGVVKEAARVVKQNGMVGIFDGDYASLTLSNGDPRKGREYDEAINKAIITNPRVMRQMPYLLRDAGLELVTSFSYVLADIGKADFWVPAIKSFRKLIPQSGVMTAEQIDAWADARLKESEEGVFFGASNYYSYIARRP